MCQEPEKGPYILCLLRAPKEVKATLSTLDFLVKPWIHFDPVTAADLQISQGTIAPGSLRAIPTNFLK